MDAINSPPHGAEASRRQSSITFIPSPLCRIICICRGVNEAVDRRGVWRDESRAAEGGWDLLDSDGSVRVRGPDHTHNCNWRTACMEAYSTAGQSSCKVSRVSQGDESQKTVKSFNASGCGEHIH